MARMIFLSLIATLLAGLAASAADFDREIAPILAGRCLECHSGPEAKGKLDLSQAKTALLGGESGPAIVAGQPQASYLIERIEAGEMPPKHPLPAAERELLRAWIAAGAKWVTDPIDPFRFTTASRGGYDWWSLAPLGQPLVPSVHHDSQAANAIDRFVLARLATARLTVSPSADRYTLIRRLAFDLTGLPPTPDEIEAFVQDASADACERLADRLLASPHYGQRWARAWLDVAHFGESDGFEYDRMRPHAWRYRDWLIEALNRDLPYDEFARQQIAGDVLRPGDSEAAIATGFLVGGVHDSLLPKGEVMQMIMRQDELEDLVALVSQTFLGLTVNCARCHDHKFDAIRQTDYYKLAAALAGVKRGNRSLAQLTPPVELASREVAARDELAALERPAREAALAKRKEGKAQQVTATAAKEPPVSEAELVAQLDDAAQARRLELQALLKQLDDLYLKRQAFAVTPQAAPVVRVLARGNVLQPQEAVAASGIVSLTSSQPDFQLPPDATDSQRRTRLAQWIASQNNPLFARTIVNRLWQHHFGRGLIETPSDLGFVGGKPSHPELVEWLASELVTRQWSLKNLHRLLVTSATYRQTSQPRQDCLAVDADNRLLWRYSPRRLDAESIRDAMLLVAGQLNCQMGGPSYMDFRPYLFKNAQYYEPQDKSEGEFQRRSVYRFWARGGRNPLLDTFDCPDTATATPRRGSTTTPLQALALFNNSFTFRMADDFAARLRLAKPPGPVQQAELAFLIAFGRQATGEEVSESAAFIEQHGLPAFCRVLLNTNGFLYVQ